MVAMGVLPASAEATSMYPVLSSELAHPDIRSGRQDREVVHQPQTHSTCGRELAAHLALQAEPLPSKPLSSTLRAPSPAHTRQEALASANEQNKGP